MTISDKKQNARSFYISGVSKRRVKAARIHMLDLYRRTPVQIGGLKSLDGWGWAFHVAGNVPDKVRHAMRTMAGGL